MKEINVTNIKFESYNGKYPNLCLGTLVLLVNDKEYKLQNVLISGGGLGKEYEPYKGDWTIKKEWLPKELEPFTKQIEMLVNDNVEHGCCGGCS